MTETKKRPENGRRLKKKQIDSLLEWIAEGLTSSEINQRAAVHEEPFSVTAALVSHYRKKHEIDIDALREERRKIAFTQGLAVAENRVAKLEQLFRMMEEDIVEKRRLWLSRLKSVGSGEVVEELEFNSNEIRELRAILDDIAKETGGRASNKNLSVDMKVKGYVGISPDDWDEENDGKQE